MLKKILQFVKNLLVKLMELKSTKSIPFNLDNKINLLLIRDTFTEESTIGRLFINGELFCDTLENPWKDNQRNISCIPDG